MLRYGRCRSSQTLLTGTCYALRIPQPQPSDGCEANERGEEVGVDSGQMAAGISLRLPSARRWAARDGTVRYGQGHRLTAEAVGRPFVHATTDDRGQVGMGRDPRGAGGATCKSPALPTQVRILSLPH
jgi:hypothetical protein